MRNFVVPWALGMMVSVAAAGAQTPVSLLQTAANNRGPSFYAVTSSRKARVDARNVSVLRKNIEVHLRQATIPEALQAIGAESGLRFAYDRALLPTEARVSLSADDITVVAALTQVLLDAGVDVELTPAGLASIVRRPPTEPLKERKVENGTITGHVVDSASRAPIPSAQVNVVGTTLGAITGDDGSFTIKEVPAGSHQVRVIRLGFRAVTKSVTVPSGGVATVDFVLAPTPISLDEVVTTATGGTERKRESGANIGVLQVDSIPLATTNTVVDVLGARVPGVSITQPNGTAGSAARVRIRGSNSISLSNDPLVIVDGVRVDNDFDSEAIYTGADGPSRINDFNPNDIADIQVIKGPAASALYGTAAANGVIQITTKRGQAGKARFDAFAEGGSIKEVTNYAGNYSQIGTTPGGQRVVGCDLILQASGVCTAVADSLMSWNPLEQASPFITGNRANYGLSVSGGSDKTTYYVGGGYQREQGVYESNKLRNVNGRVNLRSQLSTNMDVALNLGYMDGYVTRPQDGDNLNSIVSDGLFGFAFDDPVNRGYLFAPPDQSQKVETEQDVHHFTGGLTSNYSPLHWLTFTGVGGVDYVNRLDAQFVPPGVFDPVTQSSNLAAGQRKLAPYQIFNYTLNGSAVAKYGLGWLHDANASTTVGFQFNRSRTSGSTAYGQNLAPGTHSLSGATSQFSVGESNTGLATLGYLAQQQLAWNDRLFLTGAVRTDRTSAFGTNFKRVYYPTGNISWVVGDEPFFPKTDLLSSLRLRAGYGTSGQNPQFRQAITYFFPSTVTFGGMSVPGVTIGGTGNPDLRPEKSKEFEAGFDAGFFRDRINTEFTYYNKMTDDALVAQNLPPSIGASTVRYINIGKVRNTGIEVLVNGRLLNTDPVAIDLTLNGSTAHNKVVNLGAGIAPISLLIQHVQSGYPLGAYFDTPIESYSDANGDGILDPSEITMGTTEEYIGTPFPTRTLSVTPAVTFFRNVRVSALIDYRGGQRLFDYNGAVRCGAFRNCREIQDNTTPLADQAAAVAVAAYGSYAGYIEDASFTKLRELSVTLTAPDTWARHFGTRGLSLTLAGRNLHTWTNYKGVDPEANVQTTGYAAFDLESTPQVRYYTARLNVSW